MALVDFLDTLNSENDTGFQTTYIVSRCGWHRFNGIDYFIDPRINCSTSDDEKKVNTKIDSQSLFAESLRSVGDFNIWKDAYELAFRFPIARFMSAASVATPLLKILGERNFLLYVNDPTHAGKTTTLYLGSSALVDEKVIRSFDTTKNGLAGAACEFNDYPFFIDEKQVADSRIHKQLDLLVYALANGIGRTKLNKDSTLNKIPDWRTISIMTGEMQLLPVNVTGGAYTRLLTLSTSDRVILSNICKKIRDKVKYNYGFALPLVIDEIRRLGVSKLNDLYIELVRSFNKDFPNILEEHRRYVAIVTITDYLLNVALFGDSNAEEDIWNNSISNSIEIFRSFPHASRLRMFSSRNRSCIISS